MLPGLCLRVFIYVFTTTSNQHYLSVGHVSLSCAACGDAVITAMLMSRLTGWPWPEYQLEVCVMTSNEYKLFGGVAPTTS